MVNSWGIYYRRFSANGTAQMAVDHQANLTITAEAQPPDPTWSMAQSAPFAGNQVNPSIAMDADGDYVITWDGPGATANPFDPEDIRSDIDSQGVFVRTFHGQGLSEQNEAVTPETTVNTTLAGYQGLSSVAMTPDGSYVIDWAGNGVGSNDGIYVSRYTDPVDNSGPVLTGVELPSATNISSSLQVNSSVQAVVVTFDKDMLNDGSANSVTNVNNYKLLMNGVATLRRHQQDLLRPERGQRYGRPVRVVAQFRGGQQVRGGRGPRRQRHRRRPGAPVERPVPDRRQELAARRRGQPPEQFGLRPQRRYPVLRLHRHRGCRRLGIRGHAQFHLDHRPGHRFRRQRRLRRGLERRQPEPSGRLGQLVPADRDHHRHRHADHQHHGGAGHQSGHRRGLGQRRNPGQQRPDGHQCGRGPQRQRQLRRHLVGR